MKLEKILHKKFNKLNYPDNLEISKQFCKTKYKIRQYFTKKYSHAPYLSQWADHNKDLQELRAKPFSASIK